MTTYLSRLVLDPRARQVRSDLADRHALHRRVMSAFPTAPAADARAAFGILFRLEGPPIAARPTLLVQSAVPPDWSRLPDDYLARSFDGLDNPVRKAVDDRYAAIAAGDVLAFRLLANPTRRISERESGSNRLAGKRVALLREDQQLAWLTRKAADGGFALLTVRTETNDLRPAVPSLPEDALTVPAVRAMPAGEQVGFRRRGGSGADRARLTFGAVLFEGRLKVIDPARLRAALVVGIGSGKAYGFGLLSLAPSAAIERSQLRGRPA